jgi:hypothetical protein
MYTVPDRAVNRCVMALIRGYPGLYPCPRCRMSREKLGYLKENAEPRTVGHTKGVLAEARKMTSAGDKEDLLKGNGLRDVDVHLVISFTFYCFL